MSSINDNNPSSALGINLILNTAKTATESMNQMLEEWYKESSSLMLGDRDDNVRDAIRNATENGKGIVLTGVPTQYDLVQATIEGKGLDAASLRLFAELIDINDAGNLHTMLIAVGDTIKESALSKVTKERKVAGKVIGLLRARILLNSFSIVTKDLLDNKYDIGYIDGYKTRVVEEKEEAKEEADAKEEAEKEAKEEAEKEAKEEAELEAAIVAEKDEFRKAFKKPAVKKPAVKKAVKVNQIKEVKKNTKK